MEVEGAGGGRVGAGEGRVGTGGGGDSPDVEHYGGTVPLVARCHWHHLVLHLAAPGVWVKAGGTWARRGSSRARRGSGGIRRGWGGGRAGLDDVDVFWRHCWLNWHLGILVRLKFQPCIIL